MAVVVDQLPNSLAGADSFSYLPEVCRGKRVLVWG